MVRVAAADATSEADGAQEESGGVVWRLLWTDHDTITQ